MAGAGTRFAEEGYIKPKPLIEVSNKPMIIQACRSLPEANRWIFICRKEHVTEYHVNEVLEKEFRDTKIITIDYLTEGQVCTCLLAESHVNKDEPLLIGACDNGMTWDEEKYNTLKSNDEIDALIWTFRNNVTVKRNPKMYGWVMVNERGEAVKVSCKVPISNNPVRDHAIIGTFYFKKTSYFIDAAKRMIAKGQKINNEFYVDEVMNELIASGLRVNVFEVDKYICWGTPNDLRVYQYWESYFNKFY